MVAITQQTMLDEIRRQQQLARSIASDQAAISSGKKQLTPSQDPQTWVQVSELARAQAQQAAWSSNVDYAQTRAGKAESSLTELSNLMTRARELTITASTAALDAPGKAAVVTELQGIRASMGELLNEKDYQGLPVFDDGAAVSIPVSRGTNVEAVGTRQSISEGISVNGNSMSLDDILASAISAIQSGDSTDTENALTGLKVGGDHIVLQQSTQGVRSNRLEAAGDRLTTVDLDLNERRGQLEDTDPTETITRLQNKLLTLEAAQAAFARINKQSLFDLIG
ncbi:flagellar hook-associated protein FlgL [soil metagenome]